MKWLELIGALVLAIAFAWGFYKIMEVLLLGLQAKRALQQKDKSDE